jgi:hypothetical protein
MKGWVQQFQRRTPLGWLQLSYSRSRLLVALSGIAFADILMFMQLGFQASLYESNTQIRRALDADIVLSCLSFKFPDRSSCSKCFRDQNMQFRSKTA